MEDYDYVDVEGGATPLGDVISPPTKMRKSRGRPKKRSAATLEEGEFFLTSAH